MTLTFVRIQAPGPLEYFHSGFVYFFMVLFNVYLHLPTPLFLINGELGPDSWLSSVSTFLEEVHGKQVHVRLSQRQSPKLDHLVSIDLSL